MTRLKKEDVDKILDELIRLDASMQKAAGITLEGLVEAMSGCSREELEEKAATTVGAAVPVTSGLGVIPGFAEAVAAIVSYLGFSVFVTGSADVAGLYEAQQKGADWIFLADDERFLALDRNRNRSAENDRGTAKAYVTILELSAGPLASREVLVLGAGRLGAAAVEELERNGAIPVLYDKDPARYRRFPGRRILANRADLASYPLVFDATDEAGWLEAGHLHPAVFLAAPGLPFSLTEDAASKLAGRVVHDRLAIGVAGMVAELCR